MFGIKSRYVGFKKKLAKRAVILMYHSVNEPGIDPWQLAVSASNFEQQLQVLKKNYHVCSVPEIVSQLQKGVIKKNCIGLTFDDGYKDNFTNAKPLLENYCMPASFFIPTGNLLEQQSFWWDRLLNLIMRTSVLPSDFNITIRGQNLHFSIADEECLNKGINELHSQWVFTDAPPTQRSALFLSLWKMMQPLSPLELSLVLDEIQSWAGKESIQDYPQNFLMTSGEVKTLGEHKLFDIGLHTVNHVALSYHDKEEQKREIHQNQKELKQILNKSISTIAYPYGEYNNTTLEVVQELDLQAGFTVEYDPVFAKSNPYALGRFHVKNWSGKEFEKKLIKWLKQ